MEKDYEYLSDGHAAYLKQLVMEAAKKDSKLKIFGANTHKYKLNETMDIKEVRAFEKKYGVSLPEEYIFYLTKVANGGAGNFYGINPLNEKEHAESYRQHLCKENVYGDDFTQFWREFAEFIEYDEEEDSDKKFEEYQSKLCDGVIHISYQGCTFDTLLVVNGKRKGEIIYISWELEDDNPPYFTGMTFLEWYQGYFEEIAAGNSINGYGYREVTQNELIEEYQRADNPIDRRRILYSLGSFKTAEPETISLLLNLKDMTPMIEEIRLGCLFHYEVEEAIEIFEDMLERDDEIIKAALGAAYNYASNYLKSNEGEKYYDKWLEFIYGDFSDDIKRYAIGFLIASEMFSAGDLIPFVKDETQDVMLRDDCLFGIGRTKDRRVYTEDLVEILKTSKEDRILLRLLWVLEGVENPEIIALCNEFIKTYKHDETMVYHINVYMKSIGR